MKVLTLFKPFLILLATQIIGVSAGNYYSFNKDLRPELISHFHSNFAPGDVFEFPDYKIFSPIKYLNHSQTTHIYQLDDSYTLRMPINNFLKDFIDRTYKGYDLIELFKIPAVKIDRNQYLRSEYLVAEYTPVQFTLFKFIFYPNQFSRERIAFLKKALIDFALKTASFTRMGGFTSLDQIVWNGNRWVLIDWESDHVLLDDYTVKNHIFSGYKKLFKTHHRKLFKKISNAIVKERSDKDFQEIHNNLYKYAVSRDLYRPFYKCVNELTKAVYTQSH